MTSAKIIKGINTPVEGLDSKTKAMSNTTKTPIPLIPALLMPKKIHAMPAQRRSKSEKILLIISITKKSLIH